MESNWAAEHLQVIRTLMERSAVYRRALAPIMLLLGVLGLAAAAIGWQLQVGPGSKFGWYWLGMSAIGVCAGYVMVRRQALKAGEAFWSPPTRRVTEAVLPPLFAGLVVTVCAQAGAGEDLQVVRWLPPAWIISYGCAVHAAGFFMPRGMKLFGWGFLLGGSGVAAMIVWQAPSLTLLHAIMGLFFGGLHLAYGIYLSFTEQRK